MLAAHRHLLILEASKLSHAAGDIGVGLGLGVGLALEPDACQDQSLEWHGRQAIPGQGKGRVEVPQGTLIWATGSTGSTGSTGHPDMGHMVHRVHRVHRAP